MVKHPNNLRIMIDASVLIAGVSWPSFLYEILQHGVADDYRFVLSPLVIDEALACATRLFPAQSRHFLALLQMIETEIAPVPSQAELLAAPRLTRDPNNLPLALTAIKTQVDWLITVDPGLSDPTTLLHRYIRVVSPASFLRQFMRWTRDDLLSIRNRSWKEMEASSV